MSPIIEQQKICFFNVWTRIRLDLPWGKFMKALVVYINRHPRWSGCLEEPVFITLPWCLIVSSSIRGVKNVNGLVICSWCLLRWYMLLSNNGFSEVEEWSSLVRLINPPSSKVHCFVLVATDYFTKQTKAVSLKNMIHSRGNNLYCGLSHLYKMTWPIYNITLEDMIGA